MKKLLTIILSSVATLAFAQEKIDLSRTIDDNGHNLSIRVNGTIKGQFIDFEKTFKVEGLTKSERVAITDRILDSLGVSRVEEPLAPLAIMLSVAPTTDHSSMSIGSMSMTASESDHFKPVISTETNNHKSYIVGGSNPFIKEVWLDDSGFLHLRYRFTRCKEEFIYEKSTDASDKSESERQKFITDFEEEIELPAM